MNFIYLILFVGWVGGLIWSGQGVYMKATNWSPTEVNCSDFLKNTVEKDWLTLKDCPVSNGRVVEVTIGKELSYFVPIYDQNAEGSMKMAGFYQVMDPVMIGHLKNAFIYQKREGSDQKYMDKHQEYAQFISFNGRQDIQGLRQWGMDMDDDVVGQLKKYMGGKTDFNIIEVGSTPMTTGRWVAFFVCYGILLLVVVGMVMPDDKKEEETPA